jgi:hypothetical protein
MLEHQVEQMRDELRKANTLQQRDVARTFSNLREEVADAIAAAKRDARAGQHSLEQLLRQLEGATGEVKAGQSNIVQSIEAIQTGQQAARQAVDSVQQGMQALVEEKEQTRTEVLDAITTLYNDTEQADSQAIQALDTLRQAVEAQNSQVVLRDANIDRALSFVQQSAQGSNEALAELVRNGIYALGHWNLESIGGLARLNQAQAEAIYNQSAEAAQSANMQLSTLYQQINAQQQDIATIANAGNQVAGSMQNVPQDTFNYFLQRMARPAAPTDVGTTLGPGQPAIGAPDVFPAPQDGGVGGLQQLIQAVHADNDGANDGQGAMQPYNGAGAIVPQTGGAAVQADGGMMQLYQGNGPIVPQNGGAMDM